MKTELTADAVIRRIGEMCEFTDCGARTLSQRVEPLIRSFESEIRAQCEAAKKENAELRAALKEVCVYGGHEITDLLRHNYVFQRCVPETHEDARFHWVIFCTKCGHVAYFGNNTTVSNERMQADLPRPCVPTQPEDPTEAP